jgi:hypothetical protein
MFVCIATKPLNDDTQGFRFNFLGFKGLTRKRKHKSNGFRFKSLKSMSALHLGKRTIYFEKKSNRNSGRLIRHFAG